MIEKIIRKTFLTDVSGQIFITIFRYNISIDFQFKWNNMNFLGKFSLIAEIPGGEVSSEFFFFYSGASGLPIKLLNAIHDTYPFVFCSILEESGTPSTRGPIDSYSKRESRVNGAWTLAARNVSFNKERCFTQIARAISGKSNIT